ncbi:DUF1059 domain-containing protein [Halomarina pelagica]|uniref:DUF1059 domain-containing protein n=1 Tax=Halomarina pelagica TaxID=2961599 RepID=UPI0020C33280|nr:DUF1059 domain-containing protein [Halomarina sp. BND7]
MVKEVRCINAGFEDCAFLIRSEDEEEIVEVVRRHAERVHDTSTTRDHVERIMRDV